MQIIRNIGRRGLFVSFLLSMLVGLGPGRSFGATASVSLSPIRRAGSSSSLSTETASDGRRAYIVVLRDAPLVRSIAASATGAAKPFRAAEPAELDALARDLSRKQDAFEADMRGKIAGFQVGTRFRNVLNGMSVLVPEGGLSVLRSDPRVKTVYPVRKYELHLDSSNPLMNAPAFWGTVGGDANAGAGVRIADVDTGVDFSNPMFSDSSLAMPAGFPKENDGNHFANSKVIVAKYFQGIIDSTSAALNAGHQTAQDLSGHGSHTASVAAGAKVTLSGAGRRPVTMEGVAPKAYIGDYRVFAPNAFSDNIIAAIDEAVADGMDVLNMSFGLNDPNTGLEPFFFNNAGEFEAIENAIAGGMVVTISAGNSGVDASGNPLPDSISSSADIPDVIAVGATTNSHNGVSASLLARVAMTAGGAPPSVASIIGAQGVGSGVTFPAIPFSAPFVDWDNSDGAGDSLGCTKVIDPLISGKVVLIQRGSCTFTTKVGNAATAGAMGVVIYNCDAASSNCSTPGGDALLVPSVDGTTIPAIFVTRTDGLNLKAYLDANPGASAPTGSFGPAPAGTPAATFAAPSHDLASFSSNGPTLDFQIKPDLTSVGVGSYAACQDDDPLGEGRFPFPDPDSGQDTPLFDPSGFTFGDGTSFSAPRAAGSAALMVQKHPNWSPAEIKAALMETATRPTDPNDASRIGNLSVMQRGSGDIDLAAASAVGAVVLPASQSFRQVFLNGAPAAGSLTPDVHAREQERGPGHVPAAGGGDLRLERPRRHAHRLALDSLARAGDIGHVYAHAERRGLDRPRPARFRRGRLDLGRRRDHFRRSLRSVLDPDSESERYAAAPRDDVRESRFRDAGPGEHSPHRARQRRRHRLVFNPLLGFDRRDRGLRVRLVQRRARRCEKTSPRSFRLRSRLLPSAPTASPVSVQLFDKKGFASNVLQARYKAAPVRSVPSSNGSDFRRVVPLVANTQGAGSSSRATPASSIRRFDPVTVNAFLVAQGQAASSALGINHLVEPRESLALNDLCLNDFDSPGSVGSLVLVAADGSSFHASSRAYTRNSDGTFGMFVPTSTPAQAVGAADGTATANGFETAAGFHTNVGATEASGQTTTVGVQGFDESGASVETSMLTLLPYSNQQYNPLTDTAHHFTAPAARVDFTVLPPGSGRVIPYGATVDEGSGDTLLSVAKTQTESADDLFITEVAHTHGAFNSFLTSDLSATNRSAGPRTFSVSLLPAFGTTGASAPAPITVASGQTLVFKDVLQSLFGLTGDSGAGLLIHPQTAANLFVSARTSTPNGAPGGTGTYGFFVTGAKATDALSAGGKKVSIHLAHNSDFRTNFGFTEVTGSPVTVRATFFDENGTPQGTKAYPLGAHATDPDDPRRPARRGELSNGYIEFTVDSGSGKALVFAAEIDNHTNDLIYVPGESE